MSCGSFQESKSLSDEAKVAATARGEIEIPFGSFEVLFLLWSIDVICFLMSYRRAT